MRGLTKRYGATRALDGVSFSIAAGQTLGLVGESGSGKSTLARALLRLEPLDGGTIHIDGVDVRALDARALRGWRQSAQLIFQDPTSALDPRWTVAQILDEPLHLHHLHGRDRAARIAELLAQVGLSPDAATRRPHEFSGGQRQRIAIARALATAPRFLVADEPVAALDVSIQAQIIRLLVEQKARAGLTCLFITHDLGLVPHVCDRVAVLHRGRIVEEGAVAQLFSAPRHPYTQALLAAQPPRIGLR